MLKKDRVLIEKLISKTQKGLLNWKSGSANEQYVTRLKSGMIVLTMLMPPELPEEATLEISIINKKGDRIHEFSAARESNAVPDNYYMMENLFSLIEDKYYETNTTLKNIMDELASNAPVEG